MDQETAQMEETKENTNSGASLNERDEDTKEPQRPKNNGVRS